MKNLLGTILVALAFCVPAFAQPQPQQTLPTFQVLSKLGSGGRVCVTNTNLTSRPYNDHSFIYTFPDGAPSAVTLTVYTSTAGVNPPVTSQTTGTSTTGGTMHFTGAFTNICVEGTSFTGVGPATIVYVGAFAQSLGSVSTDLTDLLAALTAGTAKNQICDAGGDCVTVTGSKLDVAISAASGAVASGAFASGSVADGAIVTLGTKADAKSTATDTTPLTLMQVNKQISASVQAIAALAATDDCLGTIPSKEYYISVGSSEDEHQIKATAGTLCGISARNAHASANAFLKCTNLTAANTTPGSSAIFYEMMVPFGGGYVDNHIDVPFSVALTCYIVTGKAASDATEVGADDVSYVLRYR